MEKTFAKVLTAFQEYIGDGRYFIIFGICLVLCFLLARKREEIHYFFHYTLILGIVLFLPFTAQFIAKGIGSDVYWRMFWMVPVVLVIAFVLTKLIRFIPLVSVKGILIAVCCEMLIITGTFIYSEGQFVEVPNDYKLPSDTLQVAEIILEDAGEDAEEIRLTVPNTLACDLRQYDARFIMPVGRNYESMAVQDERYEMALDLSEKVRNPHVYPPIMLEALEDYGCQYVVLSKNDGRIYSLSKYECVELGQSNSYVIFKLPDQLNEATHEEAEYLRERTAKEEAAKVAEENGTDTAAEAETQEGTDAADTAATGSTDAAAGTAAEGVTDTAPDAADTAATGSTDAAADTAAEGVSDAAGTTVQ